MEGKLQKGIKTKPLKVKKLPDDYKILDIVIKGRQIVVNIQEMLELANVYNKAEVLASMNKACSNYHYFARVESDFEEVIIKEKENFELWKAAKKAKYTGKEFSSEASKDRELMNEYREMFQKKTKTLAELGSYKRQTEIAKKSLEKYIDMIKSINTTIRNESPDPGPTSETDD